MPENNKKITLQELRELHISGASQRQNNELNDAEYRALEDALRDCRQSSKPERLVQRPYSVENEYRVELNDGSKHPMRGYRASVPSDGRGYFRRQIQLLIASRSTAELTVAGSREPGEPQESTMPDASETVGGALVALAEMMAQNAAGTTGM